MYILNSHYCFGATKILLNEAISILIGTVHKNVKKAI